jgi:hypothetical protein
MQVCLLRLHLLCWARLELQQQLQLQLGLKGVGLVPGLLSASLLRTVAVPPVVGVLLGVTLLCLLLLLLHVPRQQCLPPGLAVQCGET